MENEEKPQDTATQLITMETPPMSRDVIGKILMRVPARSLLRFQLVCKDWRAIIQEPWFKKAHLELKKRTSEPLQLLSLKKMVFSYVVREEVMVLDKDLQPHEIWTPQDLGIDWHFRGSCNGLLCTERNGEITVFNPVTREVVSLPKPTNITEYGSVELEETYTEFVFHLATGEYKVILFYKNAYMARCDVYMYVLGANSSWRHIDKICEFPSSVGVNVDDIVYWPYVPEDEGVDPFIMSFDLSKEQIEKFSSPMQDANLVGLTTWNDKLCEASFGEDRQSINIRIFDNSTWTLKHEIQLTEIDDNVLLLAPYSIKSNRVFIATYYMIFYHEISGNRDNIQEIPVKRSCEIKNCFAYVESLLPVPK